MLGVFGLELGDPIFHADLPRADLVALLHRAHRILDHLLAAGCQRRWVGRRFPVLVQVHAHTGSSPWPSASLSGVKPSARISSRTCSSSSLILPCCATVALPR